MTISEQVAVFKKDRISNEILLSLYRAVEMLVALKYKTDSCSRMSIVSEIVLIREIRYSFALEEKDMVYSDIIYDMLSATRQSEFSDQYYCVKKCVEYADETLTTVKMLPATDFLRIYYQLGAQRQDFLHYESFAAVLEKGSKGIWEAVDGLCNCKPYLHELLDLAIAAYWLENLNCFDTIDVLARNILFSSYLKKQGKINYDVVFLNKQYLLFDDFAILANTENISDYILFFLDKLTDVFIELYAFIEKIEKLIQIDNGKIESKLPKMYSKQLCKTLYGSIGIKYTDLSIKLNVTPKTAQEYLKRLEHLNIWQSKKIGKERIFVNSSLIQLLEEEL